MTLGEKSQEGNGTREAERRKLNHCIEGSGGRQEGSVTLINKKEQRGSSIKDKGQKSEAVHSTHDHCREAWKTAESCGVMGSSYLKDKEDRLSLIRVGLLLGQAHSVVKARPLGCL